VGGLVNTVFDRDYEETLPPEKRNGYVFYSQDDQGLESAMGRAIDLWKKQPKEFEKLAIQGMQYDYSWNLPGEKYLEIYDWIRHKW
jgi:starch synthase